MHLAGDRYVLHNFEARFLDDGARCRRDDPRNGRDSGVVPAAGKRLPIELLPADVQSGDVHLAGGGLVLPRVRALELRLLGAAKEAAVARDRLQRVLGAEERVILAQPLPFRFDKAPVIWVAAGHVRPGGA